MQKIKRGSNFRGLIKYALSNSHSSLIGGNLSSSKHKEMTHEFNISQNLRPEIKKPVWHNSLRLPKGEKLSPSRWCQIADEYLRRMGFSDFHQRAYILHDEEEGQHVHIIASRIGLDGSLYLGRNENLISTKQIFELEKVYKLKESPLVPPERTTESDRDLSRPKSGESNLYERINSQPIRYKIAQSIDLATRGSPSILTFVERLKIMGVATSINFSSDKINGFSFENSGVFFKGSQIGKKYSARNILNRLNNNVEDREIERLKELKLPRALDRENRGTGDLTQRLTSSKPYKPVSNPRSRDFKKAYRTENLEHIKSGSAARKDNGRLRKAFGSEKNRAGTNTSAVKPVRKEDNRSTEAHDGKPETGYGLRQAATLGAADSTSDCVDRNGLDDIQLVYNMRGAIGAGKTSRAVADDSIIMELRKWLSALFEEAMRALYGNPLPEREWTRDGHALPPDACQGASTLQPAQKAQDLSPAALAVPSRCRKVRAALLDDIETLPSCSGTALPPLSTAMHCAFSKDRREGKARSRFTAGVEPR
ncbi:relaxase/mobilization nuclease domain-containing protein [Pseudomonas aeruginosa]